VAPLALPDDHSLALASNAKDVVEQAKIVTTLDEALADTTLAFALTSRKREFNQHLQTPKESILEILTAINSQQKVALVFGGEKSGLTIDQVEKCNRLITIPGNPAYFSLNLAQAVQIICYEIFSNYNSSVAQLKSPLIPASFADKQGILRHLDTILAKIDFYKHKNIERTQRRLQHIIQKANLEREEVDLLRGILAKIEHHVKH
ncbi:MAG: RNA methyltransferase, partial [Burkholderiales bacterium]